MQRIIIMVIVIVIIKIVIMFLRKSSKTAEAGTYNGTIYIPTIWKNGVDILMYLCGIAAASAVLYYGIADGLGVSIIFLVIGMMSVLLRIMIQRYRIIVKEDYMILTPAIGKTRTVAFKDVEMLKLGSNGGIKIIVNGKKIMTVDIVSFGYKEFYELLQEKGYVIK